MTKNLPNAVVIYDATDTKPGVELSDAWRGGATAYRAFRRITHLCPARSWDHAFGFLSDLGTVDEVQFWGHGSPGAAYLNGERMPVDRLGRLSVRKLWWFRTCASFQGAFGREFAVKCVDQLGCRVAGHTHNIGLFQSGLHSVRPVEQPSWPRTEGARGSIIKWSNPFATNTVTCLASRVPEGW